MVNRNAYPDASRHGQEAAAVGVCGALAEGDVAYTHHRSHNPIWRWRQWLCAGGEVVRPRRRLFAGPRRLGASDRSRAWIYRVNGDPGETIACAVGSALAFRMDGKKSVAVTFFGDGACEEGIVYECLNYASIHKLPVIFVCENNLYATESPLSTRQPGAPHSLNARAVSKYCGDRMVITCCRFTKPRAAP